MDCAYIWNWVEAPTEITAGSVAGEPIVDIVPESPLEAVTVVPAGGGGVVEELDHVLRGVGEFVVAERLVEHVHVVAG